jgi:DNA repair photolyase
MTMIPPGPHGRGSHLQPPNRFTLRVVERDLDALDAMSAEDLDALRKLPTKYVSESAGSVVTQNDSPDIPFRYSLNPYRGCLHGCAYCYARPTHEYYGLSAGLDFESVIFVKEKAPQLLRDWLNRPGYSPEPVTLSGVTDPYQPVERDRRLTRGCLEVAAEARQPVGIVTKNALILRDLDLLQQMAADNLVRVAMAVTTLDAVLARSMEPRTTAPHGRLRAIRELSEAGVPVRVLLAPVIPGLTDDEMPAILDAARQAGARAAGYTLLRLPGAVEAVFLEWLAREQPARRERIEAHVRATRGGKLNDPRFGKRMSGEGPLAAQIRQMFKLFVRRHGLDGGLPEYDVSQFRPPRGRSGQGWLF